MAQGNQRPGKHSRQASRIITRFNTSLTEPQNPRNGRATNKDPGEDATVAFIKQTLCVRSEHSKASEGQSSLEVDLKPLEDLLPPLTSSNEIDVQLYALLAVILNQFVQTWYNKITPDQDFVKEIVQIVAHCTRGLEQRIRSIGIESLLLDELPELVDAHLEAVRIASQRSNASPIGTTAREIFHTLHRHPALTPVPDDSSRYAEQNANETLWSQLLVSKVLSLVLPPEDLQNPCLHVLVSEVFAEMIVHNGICGKACESWLIWEGVTKAIYFFRPDLVPQPEVGASPNRLEQFGLLSSTDDSRQATRSRGGNVFDTMSVAFWSLLQGIALAWLLGRTFLTALAQASSLAPRTSQSNSEEAIDEKLLDPGGPNVLPSSAETEKDGSYVPPFTIKPIVTMRAWALISHLVLLEQRMPWLSGLLSLLQWLLLFGPGQLCRVDSAVDRLLSSQIHKRILNAALLPPALRAIRSALFAGNAMGPARTPPTPEQVLEIKRECARVVVEAVPDLVRVRFFATHDVEAMKMDAESTLDLFGDSYINKHLVVSAVDLLVVRLFPELGGEGRL